MKLTKPVVFGSAVVLIGIIIALFVNYSARKIMTTYESAMPYVALGDNVKNKTTTGHLWFEEYMAGDESLTLENDILPNFTSSQELIKNALEGGETELGTFSTCTDPELKKLFNKSSADLDEFIEVCKKRGANKKLNDRLENHFGQDSLLTLSNGEEAGGELDQEFDRLYEVIQDDMTNIITVIDTKLESDQSKLQNFNIIILVSTIVLFVIMGYFIYRNQEKTEKLTQNDQAKLAIESARLEKLSDFVSYISRGDFTRTLDTGIANDELAISLNEMKETLRTTSESDKKRNWATNGIAEIGDILRKNNSDLKILYDDIIRFTVKYLNANQGSLFLINEDHENDHYLELVATYAYDKKKYVEKRVEFGEGLLGQCYLEQDIIYLTDVPNMYTSITSGLGEATPGCIIITPLKVNDEVNGVMEIASFTPLETHEIEFVKRLAESVASVITSTRITEKTSRLLEQTQQQREEMRAQEEELRQNLEELQATQEEFARKEQAYIDEIARLNK